jgi:hypothetical protein
MLPPIMDADISEAARSADLGVNVDNEKSQEDLANMLRLLIAKFCDQHFIKQLQKAKLTHHRSSQLSDHNESKMDTSSTTSGTQSNLVVDENASDDVNSTISNKNNDLNNKDKLTNEPIENETNTTKLNDDVKLDNNSSSSNEEEAKEQPNESSESKTVAYDELSDSTSDKTNNQNTDLVLNKTDNLVSPPSSDIAMNMEANPTTPTGDSSSSSSSTSSENKKSDSGISTNNSDQDATMEDCATKSIREISSSSEREHHRLHHLNLRSKDQSDEDYLVPSSKLWSTILIGADKLEIFGSIHVRSNNVRLLSCLIDEQLSIDSSEINLSFSSAASISSGSCSSKVLIKPSNKSNPKYAKLDSSRIIDLVGRQASSAAIRKSSFNDRHQTRRHHHHYRRSSRNRRYRHREHRGYPRNCCDLDVYKSRKPAASSEPKIKQSTNRRKQTSYRNAFGAAQSVQEPVGAELNEDIYDENEINKNENDENNIEDYANNQEGIDYCDYEPECGEDEYDEEELDEFNQQFVNNKDKSAHRKQHLRDQFSKMKKGGSAQKQQQQSPQKTSDASKSDGKDQAEESLADKAASNLVSNGNGAVNSDECNDQAAKSDLAMIYPMKKFKAYHHYCNSKRKLIQEEQQKQDAQDKSLAGDDQVGKEAQANELSSSEAQTITANGSSLANLANVAAAAMKLNSAETKTGKKSRKPSAPIPQNGLDHNESELDYDVDELDEHVEHKAKADYPYLYDEEDVHYDDDNSSVVSSYSTGSGHSFRNNNTTTNNNNNNNNIENGNVVVVRNGRSHSRCSTLSSGAVSSRSVSLNGSASSRSPSCSRTKHKVSRHMSHSARRNISPSPSIASSSYLNDYDDENAYRSYSSSSSYKSDYENYDYDNEEMNNEDEFNSRRRVRGHHAPRKHGDKSSRNNSNRAYYRSNGELDKRDKSNGSTIMNELVNDDEQMEFGNPEESSAKAVKPHNGVKHLSHRPSGHHHHHRRKPHHVRHDMDQTGMANDGVQSKQNDKDADAQQPMSKSPLGSSQTQAQQQSQQQVDREDRKRDEEYLMRKYKRRFMPYSSSGTNGATNGSGEGLSGLDTNSNLYLLASSRQHHRAYTSNGSDAKDNIPSGNEHHHYMHSEHLSSKLMPVNTLVDRLSPISDPDLEERNKNQNGSSYENGSAKLNGGMHLKGLNSDANGKLHHQTGNDANSDINILNRINNLSPSSSSSSSSSVKQQQQANGQLGLNGNSQLSSVFHHSSLQQQQQQQHNPAAAVLAAAAAAAAAADLRSIAAVGASPHHHHHHQLAAAHQASSQSLHNHHHAQSVAALLADMQQQQQQSQQQQDVAKVLAATLSNGQHHHHLNQHHGHAAQALLSRFSNGASQNDLMAAVLAQQQQQQQQHRSLLDSHHHHLHNNGHHHNGNYAAALNATNGQIYSRYSTHLANVAAAAAAAASSAAVHSSSHRRLI